MNHQSDDDAATRRLDEGLKALRHEEPFDPLRRDAVWNRIALSPGVVTRPARISGNVRRLAAAVMLVATGSIVGSTWQYLWGTRAANTASRDPLLASAATVLHAWTIAAGERVSVNSRASAITSSVGDALAERTALLLAATRAEVGRVPILTDRTRLLRDVEYVLAQIIQGGVQDDLERELTMDVIRNRRLIERIEDGGAQ